MENDDMWIINMLELTMGLEPARRNDPNFIKTVPPIHQTQQDKKGVKI